jgi:hypothetical protein
MYIERNCYYVVRQQYHSTNFHVHFCSRPRAAPPPENHRRSLAFTGSDGGMGQKASDYSCVPLCADCHNHRAGKGTFERQHGALFRGHCGASEPRVAGTVRVKGRAACLNPVQGPVPNVRLGANVTPLTMNR